VNALRALTETCDFGALKDQLIRDRIVCGVYDNAIRRKLLQESKLALEKINVLTFVMPPKSHLHNSKKWRQTNNNNIPVKLIWSPKDKYYAWKSKGSKNHQLDECEFCGRKQEQRRGKCPAYGQTCSTC